MNIPNRVLQEGANNLLAEIFGEQHRVEPGYIYRVAPYIGGDRQLVGIVRQEPKYGTLVTVTVLRGEFEDAPGAHRVQDDLYAFPGTIGIFRMEDILPNKVAELPKFDWENTTHAWPEWDSEAGKMLYAVRRLVYNVDVDPNSTAILCGDRDPIQVLEDNPRLEELGYSFVDVVGNCRPHLRRMGRDKAVLWQAIKVLGPENVDYDPDSFKDLDEYIDTYAEWQWEDPPCLTT